MKTGRMYLLSRETTSSGEIHETWGHEGGGTGDVEYRVTPPQWVRPQNNIFQPHPAINSEGVVGRQVTAP